MRIRNRAWMAALIAFGLLAPAHAGAVAPEPAGHYFGSTSQGGTVVARGARDGRRIASLDLDVRARCTGRNLVRRVKYETLYLAGLPLGRDGRFSRAGRIVRYNSGPEGAGRYPVEVTGTLAGGFASAGRLTGRARLRLAGRFYLGGGSGEGFSSERASCRTGRLRFFAEVPRESRGRAGALRERRRAGACVFARRRARCRHTPAVGAPDAIMLTRDGRHAYVVSSEERGSAGLWRSWLLSFKRNRLTGALTRIPGTAGCVSAEARAGCAGVRGITDVTWAGMSGDGRTLYLVSSEPPGVATLRRDPATGTLFQPPGSAGCLGALEQGCAARPPVASVWSPEVSPDGRHLYLAWDSGTGRSADRGLLWLHRNRATGALAAMRARDCVSMRGGPQCPRAPVTGPVQFLEFTRSGSHAYAALDGGPLLAFSRRAGDGALRPLAEPETCHFARGGPRGCRRYEDVEAAGLAVSPDGRNVYYAVDDAIAVLARRDNGALEQLSGQWGCTGSEEIGGCRPARGIDLLNVMELTPDGRNVYTGDYGDGLMAVFERRRDGRLLQLAGRSGCFVGLYGAPTPLHRPWRCVRTRLGDEIHAIATSPDGRHVYAASGVWPEFGGLHVFSRTLP